MAARFARSWNLKVFWTFSMGKNIFLQKGLILLKNDFKTMLFLFFPHFASGVGGFWKLWKIPHFFWKLPLVKIYYSLYHAITNLKILNCFQKLFPICRLRTSQFTFLGREYCNHLTHAVLVGVESKPIKNARNILWNEGCFPI